MPESDITSFLNDLSSQAAAWYQGVTGAPVPVPGTVAGSATLQQLSAYNAQQGLAATNPALASITSNPLIVIALLVFGGFVIYTLAK